MAPRPFVGLSAVCRGGRLSCRAPATRRRPVEGRGYGSSCEKTCQPLPTALRVFQPPVPLPG